MSESKIQPYSIPAPKYEPSFVPGDPVYEHLLKTDPKKLKRFMKMEKERYIETHAPDYEENFKAKLAEAHAHTEQWKKKTTDYKLLGLDRVDEAITKRVVKNAWRRLARKVHPDKGGSEEAFKELHAAYRRVLASAPKE
jgi:DnaJ-class molecular chaperone